VQVGWLKSAAARLSNYSSKRTRAARRLTQALDSMAFLEITKLAIKRKAHFACCLCRGVGVEIHHIIPQADGGPDTEDNAAPLCPSCHETYGANPTKRKFIREARDFWFEICATRYAADAGRIDTIHQMLQLLPTKTDMEQMISRVSATIDPSAVTDVSEATDASAPSELLNEPITDVSVKAYLRFMYGCLVHCGKDTTSILVADALDVGHTNIRSLHNLLSLSRGVVAELAQERRDAGDSMANVSDANIVQLFLAIFDEAYCIKKHPNVHAKYADKHWMRPVQKNDLAASN